MSRKRQPRIRIDPAFVGDAGAPADSAGRLFAVACPTCQGELAVTSDMAGGEARCPICAAAFTVPEPRIAEPVVPRAVPPTAPATAPPEPVTAATAPADAPAAESAPVVPAPADAPTDGGSAATRDDASSSGTAPDAPRGELEFCEPVRTITVGDTTIELRRLSPEEKRKRRARRNLVILVVGAAILFALVLALGRR